jgi:hypothetical protein
MNNKSKTTYSAKSQEGNMPVSAIKIGVSKLKETSSIAYKHTQSWLSTGKPIADEIHHSLADWTRVHSRLKRISFFLILVFNIKKLFFISFHKIKWILFCLKEYLFYLLMLFIWILKKTIDYIIFIVLIAAYIALIIWLLEDFSLY